MPDGAQLDLLDWIAPQPDAIPAPTVAPTDALPSRSYWWDEAIADSQAAQNVRIHVSDLWTGVVVEQINDPVLGRRILWNKGNVTQYPFTATCPPSRTIFMTAEGVQKLGVPLSVLDRGEGYVRYILNGEGNGL